MGPALPSQKLSSPQWTWYFRDPVRPAHIGSHQHQDGSAAHGALQPEYTPSYRLMWHPAPQESRLFTALFSSQHSGLFWGNVLSEYHRSLTVLEFSATSATTWCISGGTWVEYGCLGQTSELPVDVGMDSRPQVQLCHLSVPHPPLYKMLSCIPHHGDADQSSGCSTGCLGRGRLLARLTSPEKVMPAGHMQRAGVERAETQATLARLYLSAASQPPGSAQGCLRAPG